MPAELTDMENYDFPIDSVRLIVKEALAEHLALFSFQAYSFEILLKGEV